MQELISFISEVGFPIVISLYSLVRLESRMEDLQRTLEQIGSSLRKD